jgi:hypothetical protein
MKTIEFINVGVILYDIKFRIKNITIDNNVIKMIGITSQGNYMKLNEWFGINRSSNSNNYKKDINANPVKLLGVFPIDYDFDEYSIRVIFSVDSVVGDIDLFMRQ